MQTSSNKSSNRAVFHHNNLFFTPFRVWLFPGANLTQKNTKTVHINLQKKQCTKRNKGYSTSLSFISLVKEVTCQDSLIIHRMSTNCYRSNLYTGIKRMQKPNASLKNDNDKHIYQKYLLSLICSKCLGCTVYPGTRTNCHGLLHKFSRAII